MDIGDNWSESHDVWLYSMQLVSENFVWSGYSQGMIIAWHVEVCPSSFSFFFSSCVVRILFSETLCFFFFFFFFFCFIDDETDQEDAQDLTTLEEGVRREIDLACLQHVQVLEHEQQ